ncbi:MAG: bifunctional transcriptional activator/DNA repair protein Ada [Gemmobacter sp.]|uniref:bifunctional transcriptional activator/DNA repair enzyme AdaA n=1 Tax=Gemmobacter sp. TaxID=1898957 RepID=UPI001A4F57E6|nr:trifunctional transcriptional activator/DNA repair protein Ada/methylated-DNA--[protein]-cysteine S-methyltransferase [Gemmobacter sp.]MBL8561038.1 bifunctional transcriptional activator/DNA repair protein Ada [Gemmobacter sp.]
MMFDLPDPDTLYAALLARDPSWDGRAFVAVASTRIFCRLSCPAPKPLRANCSFHETAAACLAAGCRPCKRCNPLGEVAPAHAALLEALRADPGRRWSEADLVARGFDPSTLRRAFKRQFGQSFLEMARAARLAHGGRQMAAGAPVIDAQLEAGFDSASGFRAGFARLLGHAPAVMKGEALKGEPLLQAAFLETGLGGMVTVCDDRAVYLLEFTSRKALPREMRALSQAVKGRIGLGRTVITDRLEAELAAYFAGESAAFTLPLAPLGTPFQRRVWEALRALAPGEVVTYAALAARIGRPEAVRAVAAANGANPVALLIPCHRVIGVDGSLTGYGGGLWRKDRLIALERRYLERGESLDAARETA